MTGHSGPTTPWSGYGGKPVPPDLVGWPRRTDAGEAPGPRVDDLRTVSADPPPDDPQRAESPRSGLAIKLVWAYALLVSLGGIVGLAYLRLKY